MSMFIATFNQTTGWSGKTITYDEDRRRFILQDYGHIPGQVVLGYDARGQLDWADESLREWSQKAAQEEAEATKQEPPELTEQPGWAENKPKKAKFKFVNYDGGFSSHRQETKGLFVLDAGARHGSPDERIVVSLEWSERPSWRKGGEVAIGGSLARFSVGVQATGLSSCRVAIRDVLDPSKGGSFELPNNAASDVEAALKERESGIAAAREELAARTTEQAAQKSAPQPPQKPLAPVSFNPAHYLGGHPNLGRGRSGTLWFSPLEVGIGITRPKVAVLQLANVASVEVTSTQVAKNKVKAEIMFGVLGGLGAKGSETDTAIAVYTKDDQIAYYQVDKKTEAQVRARITPVLRAASVPFRDEAAVQTQQEALREAVAQAVQSAQGGGAPSVADELAKLAQLRDQGILTDEEFAAQKAKLLH